MTRKNLLSLHEAIVIVLINTANRTSTFTEIETFIEERNLFPIRKGNISLSEQIMLRTTKSSGRYKYLFEQVDSERIRLKNI